jgi:hypothetical protein
MTEPEPSDRAIEDMTKAARRFAGVVAMRADEVITLNESQRDRFRSNLKAAEDAVRTMRRILGEDDEPDDDDDD